MAAIDGALRNEAGERAEGGGVPALCAWAERVLFGTSLADKLAPMPAGSMAQRRAAGGLAVDGTAVDGPMVGRRPRPRGHPEAPGRPPELAFPAPGRHVRAALPLRHELDRDEARGRLFHFFANHELLALELFALCIVRFPDAPERFLRGIAATLVDEQRHLRAYLERMDALGVPLGSQPLSRWFWDALRDAEDPKTYCARLALTLEQANLDHALAYGRAFGAVGDRVSAAVMEQVFQDEIRHVRHGARWLAKWTDPETPLWEAWTSRLGPLLGPFDARGAEFSVAARAAVGLPVEAIARLAATPRRADHRPALFYGNFDAEEEVRSGRLSPVESGPAAEAARDLEPLLAWLADDGDVLLVREPIDAGWLTQRMELGMPAVRVEVIERAHWATRGGRKRHPLERETLGALRPWANTPSSDYVLAPFRAADAQPLWSQGHRELFSKATAASSFETVHAALVGAGADPADLLPLELGPTVLRDPQALDLKGRRTVLKRIYSQAGRDRRFAEGLVDASLERFVRESIAADGALVVDPWHDRLADASLHFDVDAQGCVVRVGFTRFWTDPRGRYLGTLLHPPLGGLEPSVRGLLHRLALGPDRPLPRALAQVLGPLVRRSHGSSMLGVDVLVARGPAGRPVLHPLVEINPRATLGRVALALGEKIARGVPAAFVLLARDAWPAAGFQALHSAMVLDPHGRWTSGCLALMPEGRVSTRLGVVVVGAQRMAELSELPGCESLSRAIADAER